MFGLAQYKKFYGSHAERDAERYIIKMYNTKRQHWEFLENTGNYSCVIRRRRLEK